MIRDTHRKNYKTSMDQTEGFTEKIERIDKMDSMNSIEKHGLNREVFFPFEWFKQNTKSITEICF